MRFIADFHIHSKYSRATSKDMDIERLARAAKIKGIQLMGTGDWTHPLWLKELKSKLESKGNGVFVYDDINFILTAEVSSIFSRNGKLYRVHNIIFAPDFKTVEKINAKLAPHGTLSSDGRPMLGLDTIKLADYVFDSNDECLIAPAHAWTPWFSVFGSMSGFDTVEDCFGKFADKIFCLETGLSSDPAMNWRISKLDKYCLISNSDSHSPAKIGREANVFDCKIDYKEIFNAIKNKDKSKFLYTIEFFPAEGKYHFDGHRLCGIRFSPAESKKNNNICPKCKKPITIGVMNRVNQIADRPEGFVPENAIPFKNLIPLNELIAQARGVAPSAKSVAEQYNQTIARLGSEFGILLDMSDEDIKEHLPVLLAKAVLNVRNKKLKILPGFDGEYGKISVLSEEDRSLKNEQPTLF